MPSTDILVYPIDLVANILNSIKEDKIAKRAKFCIPYELQHFRKFLFGLLPDLLIHVQTDSSQPLCLHKQQKKKRAK